MSSNQSAACDMVSLKQEFDLIDYFGPVAVALAFALIVLLISVFILNFFFISKYDEPTVFEKIGSRHNLRFGPHSIEEVQDYENRYGKTAKLKGDSASETSGSITTSSMHTANEVRFE